VEEAASLKEEKEPGLEELKLVDLVPFFDILFF
jgi:hypothetical protein